MFNWGLPAWLFQQIFRKKSKFFGVPSPEEWRKCDKLLSGGVVSVVDVILSALYVNSVHDKRKIAFVASVENFLASDNLLESLLRLSICL